MLTPELLKSLFGQLVDACGGVLPAAAVLGVSHQRISQLRSATGDQPSVMAIARLEAFVGQPIVTGQLARMADSASAAADPMKEAVEVVVAAGAVIDLVSRRASSREIAAACVALKRETDDVIAANAS